MDSRKKEEIMKIGYARTSTKSQSLNSQIDALEKAGCTKILTEKMSGKIKERPVLEDIIQKIKDGYIRRNDIICVLKLDRLSRSRKHLFELHDFFEEYGINLISLSENLDTTTPMGRAMFGMLAILAQLEREWISERTIAGLESSRARGRKGGRKKVDEKQLKRALKMYDSKDFTIKEIAQSTGIAKPTLYKYLKLRNQESE
jgi:DNA invertase Pin-like site-specific DNA recombinase